eukprot:SAG11_NODE_430_length_9532_cov_13.089685_2_plen_62_part_00
MHHTERLKHAGQTVEAAIAESKKEDNRRAKTAEAPQSNMTAAKLNGDSRRRKQIDFTNAVG